MRRGTIGIVLELSTLMGAMPDDRDAKEQVRHGATFIRISTSIIKGNRAEHDHTGARTDWIAHFVNPVPTR